MSSSAWRERHDLFGVPHRCSRAGRHRPLHSMWFSKSEQCRRSFFSAVIFLFSGSACLIATKFTAKLGPVATIQSRKRSVLKIYRETPIFIEKSHSILRYYLAFTNYYYVAKNRVVFLCGVEEVYDSLR